MYKIDLAKAASEIKKLRAKKVLLQLPDGLKPKAFQLAEELKLLTNVEILIWAGSNFGGCDIPHVEDVDLIINVGHSEFRH